MSRIFNLFRHEAIGGIILILASIFALTVANSDLQVQFHALLNYPLTLDLYFVTLNKNTSLWINDGLMALFFLLVSIEIKREIKTGALSTWKKASFPLIAALGGMIIPAALFWGLAHSESWNNGWAIPMATDIAFALGVLSLLGSKVPSAAKVFLLALAVIDDFGAIAVIATFYTEQLHLLPLSFAAVLTLGLIVLNRLQIHSLAVYAIIGVLLWVAILKSGIHATIAGVILGFVLPQPNTSLDHLEHQLSQFSKFCILPLFALANAGVVLSEQLNWHEGVASAVMLGLLVGKPMGILSFSWIAYRLKWIHLPDHVTWSHLIGISFLCGIGFTMSIFISNLAYPHDLTANTLSKFAILSASVAAAVAGYLWLYIVSQKSQCKGEVCVSS